MYMNMVNGFTDLHVHHVGDLLRVIHRMLVQAISHFPAEITSQHRESLKREQ